MQTAISLILYQLVRNNIVLEEEVFLITSFHIMANVQFVVNWSRFSLVSWDLLYQVLEVFKGIQSVTWTHSPVYFLRVLENSQRERILPILEDKFVGFILFQFGNLRLMEDLDFEVLQLKFKNAFNI